MASKPMSQQVLDFLASSDSDVPDKDFHQWAEKQGFNVHKAEAEAYKLARRYALFTKNGRSNAERVSEKDVDPKELALGIKVEMEHTDDPEMAKRIALDHLAEMPDYYSRLVAMEKSAKRELKLVKGGREKSEGNTLGALANQLMESMGQSKKGR